MADSQQAKRVSSVGTATVERAEFKRPSSRCVPFASAHPKRPVCGYFAPSGRAFGLRASLAFEIGLTGIQGRERA